MTRARPRSAPPPCVTTLSSVFASAIQAATVSSDGMRRTVSGRAATSSWKVCARFAGLRCASSAGESTPAASSRSAYSEPTPLSRMRSAWFTHSRISLAEIPVADSIPVRPWDVAPRSSSVSVFVMPAATSFAA